MEKARALCVGSRLLGAGVGGGKQGRVASPGSACLSFPSLVAVGCWAAGQARTQGCVLALAGLTRWSSGTEVGGGVALGFPEKTQPVNYTFAPRANILNAFLSINKINDLVYIINKDI